MFRKVYGSKQYRDDQLYGLWSALAAVGFLAAAFYYQSWALGGVVLVLFLLTMWFLSRHCLYPSLERRGKSGSK